ncbi:MAG: SurA N-terminal domain-containing protein [Geodermatophilaceae bacterium]|nr:SurA N-terminal domain-containing protein [Geodermatophilaceae bacterium]MDQ3455294.1 SurA N-terminal domain-containing protein [Actinomycetota bacterium]
MPAPRLIRPLAMSAALLAALLALSACRTSPGTAAYVGSETITTAELDSAVDAGLRDAAVAEVYDGRLGEYRQLLLQGLIDTEVYDAVAAKYGVVVSPAEVSARFADLVEGQGVTAEDFLADQAAQGRTETAVREQIRQFIITEEVAAEADLDEATGEDALQAQYEATRDQYAQFSVGLITVADQATADAVLAALTADPASYLEQATAYAGPNTLPDLQTATADQLSGLVPDVSALQAGQGFTAALLGPDDPSITVVFIAGIDYPTFEDLRPTLEQQTSGEVQAAVETELQAVRESLNITVNPRYGSYDDGVLGPAGSDVVSVLDRPAVDEPALN